MFSGPLEQSRPWDAKAIVGPFRLLQRVWRVVVDENTGEPHVSDDDVPDELNRLLHKTIHAVREGYETLRFNTSIARITELNNAITQAYPHGGAPRALAEPLVLMLAPLAPHIAEELWSRLGHVDVAGLGTTSRSPTRRCWSTTRSRCRCRSTASCAR